MDSVTISIDGISFAITVFVMYKIISIEYRLKRIERIIEVIADGLETRNGADE